MSLFKPTFWQIPLVSLDVQERLAEKTATLKQRLHQIADSHHNTRFAITLSSSSIKLGRIRSDSAIANGQVGKETQDIEFSRNLLTSSRIKP